MKLKNIPINNNTLNSNENNTLNLHKLLKNNLDKSKKKRFKLKYLMFFTSFVLLIFFISIFVFSYFRSLDLKNLGIDDASVFDTFKYVASAISSSDKLDKLKNSKGRTNFLIVGIDSRKEYVSLLTDSIILMSYNHSTKNVISISIPRDLRVKYANNVYSKINAVMQFKFNELKTKYNDVDRALEESFNYLETILKEILNLDIHYGVLINFEVFKQTIDLLGGIDVYIERSFVDHEFPNSSDTALITISFQQGWEHMNGERALQYARSRKGNNGEGTDYARARRQQIVINAVKDKFLKSDFFTQVSNFNSLFSILSKNIKFFNFKSSDIELLISNKEMLKDITINSLVITPEIGSYTGHILKTGDFNDGVGWVIYPVKQDFSELITYVSDLLDNEDLFLEKAKIFLGYSNLNSYRNYIKIKNSLFNKFKAFDFNDNLLYLNNSIKNVQNNDNSNNSIVYMYVLDKSKVSTINYYYDFINNLGFNVVILQDLDENTNKQFANILGNYDVVILLN